MGNRGPKAQSEEMKQRKGNPSKRKPKAEKGAFNALSERPRVPRYLCGNKIAAAEYRRISKELVAAGKLTKMNLKGLEAYCLNYATLREAQKDVSDKGQVTHTEKGYPVVNPSVGIANKAQKEMRDWLKVFENTKAATDKPKEDPLQAFLGKKKTPSGGNKGLRRVK